MGWYPCPECCDGPVTIACANCDSGVPPLYMTVGISGLANSNCSSCTSYDGTYICVFNASRSNSTTCFWDLWVEQTYGCPDSSPSYWMLVEVKYVNDGINPVSIQVAAWLHATEGSYGSPNAGVIGYLKTSPSSDCADLTGELTGWTESYSWFDCDVSGVTLTVVGADS